MDPYGLVSTWWVSLFLCPLKSETLVSHDRMEEDETYFETTLHLTQKLSVFNQKMASSRAFFLPSNQQSKKPRAVFEGAQQL